MNVSLRKTRFLLCLVLVMALAVFALPPPLAVAYAGQPAVAEVATLQAEEVDELVFTPPLAGASAFVGTRKPAANFAAYLSEASGLPVVTFVPTDYGNTLLGLKQGKYDIVFLPAPLFVKASAELGAIPAFSVGANGSTTETGLVVVAADSGMQELADLEGKLVGSANLESAASWLLPAAALKDAGVNPMTDIDAQFTGTDADSLLGVLNGDYDAAFVLSSALEDAKVLEAHPDAADKLTVIAEYADLPIGVIAFRADLPEADQAALIAALGAPEIAEAVDAEGTSLLAGLGWDSLAPASNADFAAVYSAAATLGMFPQAE